ncbi:bifunctional adenosylcobinamide kinase/adenosylcobinamide-phosphate guanylyltransferase [Anaerostipes sp.]|uniref:bifunctional adenosylcobinamide kinase/adenosylcobinamide-phosphate guanylyltransferase n=1 Tax=Anaerostipes sp. TaxID=1872530 RepID=UPI003FF0AE68
MLYLITGGSASGKSEYAENLAVKKHREIFGDGKLLYAAFMYPYDEECKQRIERHRQMRKEKGFETIEPYICKDDISFGRRDVVLMECMSNLLANEMYLDGGVTKRYPGKCYEDLEDIITSYIKRVEENVGCVVIVTNEIFADGMPKDLEMRSYVTILGQINQKLAKMSTAAVEVVCSIPVFLKGEEKC